MDGSRHTNALDLFLRKSQLSGNGAGKVRRPDLVTGGVRVSCFHRGGHDLDGRAHCPSETIQGLPELFLRLLARGYIAKCKNRTEQPFSFADGREREFYRETAPVFSPEQIFLI